MEEDLRGFLELDLEYLHRTVDKFDGQRFSIKNWTITTNGALLALAISSKNASVPLIGIFTLTFFFYMEVIHMEMQVRVMNRCTVVSELLHAYIRGSTDLPDEYKFGVRESWRGRGSRWAAIPQVLAPRPELYLFYLGQLSIMVSSSVLLALLF